MMQPRMLLATSVVLLCACDSVDPAAFVDVELILSDSVLVLGSPITVDVAVTNVGPRMVRVSQYQCPPTFEVQDTIERVVVDWSSVLCTLAAIPALELDPGESFGFQYGWDGSIPDSGGGYLQEGEYLIRGWMVVSPNIRSYSNALELVVTGRAVR